MTKPVWLLDVDGVINAIGRKPNTSVWPAECWNTATINSYHIAVAQPVVDFINSVHESGEAEIRWHTTWMGNANLITREFGLPEFSVADDVTDGRTVTSAAALLQRRGSGWWKRPAAWRVLLEEGRPLIWTDDDITWYLGRAGRDELASYGPCLLVSPDQATGLTSNQLNKIEDFLHKHTDNY